MYLKGRHILLMDNIECFCKARQYLVESIEPTIDCFLTGIWDPHIKYVLIKETNEIIDRDLRIQFPDLPQRYLPKVKFRLHEEAQTTEVSIQTYFNRRQYLIYLGSAGIAGQQFDFYFRESFDPRASYIFISKYGHAHDHYYSGSKTAEAEYYMGAVTPLAIAYGMALEDGVI